MKLEPIKPNTMDDLVEEMLAQPPALVTHEELANYKARATAKLQEVDRAARIDELEKLEKRAWVNFENMGKAVVIVQSIKDRLASLKGGDV